MATTTTPVRTATARRALISARSATAFVVLLATVSLFSDGTYEGGRSLTGQFLQLLGSSATAVGFAAGAGEFLGYALRYVSGYWADRTGAYWKLALTGYAIQLLAMPMLAFAGAWQVAIALMFLERIGKAIRNPARDAMLSYAAKEMGRGWGFALHHVLDQTGSILGPLLMALVLALRAFDGTAGVPAYQDAFRVLFIPAIVALAILAAARFLFPRPQDLESKTPVASTAGLSRKYWLYVIGAGFIGAGYADFALMAYHFKATAIATDQVIPVFFSFAILFDVAFSLVAGRIYDRGRGAILVVAFGLTALSAPFAFLGDLPLVLVGLALWGVGSSAQDSILKAALADVIPSRRRAYGFGAYALVFGAFWFAGSTLLGVLYDHSILALVVFSVGIQLVALPIFVTANRAQAPAS